MEPIYLYASYVGGVLCASLCVFFIFRHCDEYLDAKLGNRAPLVLLWTAEVQLSGGAAAWTRCQTTAYLDALYRVSNDRYKAFMWARGFDPHNELDVKEFYGFMSHKDLSEVRREIYQALS